MDQVAKARSTALGIQLHTDEGFDKRMAEETHNRLDSILSDLDEWRKISNQAAVFGAGDVAARRMIRFAKLAKANPEASWLKLALECQTTIRDMQYACSWASKNEGIKQARGGRKMFNHS
jgi:hypothetical protein